MQLENLGNYMLEILRLVYLFSKLKQLKPV